MASFGLPNGWPSFIDWLSESCFCRHMPVYPGAVEFVATLREFAEVVAVTSPFVGVRNWEADRREWLYEHFYISPKDVIFAHRKELVRGDVLVDDKPSNVEAFAREPGQTGLLFTQPWNARHLGGWHVRVTGYKEALRKVREWSDAAGELRVRAGA
ncbi:5'(3')-deoxyribonucleotidase [Caudoviricetes sp.]|nr:5'(3')-deoxyribonucleotidase [Caudoviricetes sp.]